MKYELILRRLLRGIRQLETVKIRPVGGERIDVELADAKYLIDCIKENDAMRKTLKFYANPTNHESPIFDEHGQFNGSEVDKDGGEKARNALGNKDEEFNGKLTTWLIKYLVEFPMSKLESLGNVKYVSSLGSEHQIVFLESWYPKEEILKLEGVLSVEKERIGTLSDGKHLYK